MFQYCHSLKIILKIHILKSVGRQFKSQWSGLFVAGIFLLLCRKASNVNIANFVWLVMDSIELHATCFEWVHCDQSLHASDIYESATDLSNFLFILPFTPLIMQSRYNSYIPRKIFKEKVDSIQDRTWSALSASTEWNVTWNYVLKIWKP